MELKTRLKAYLKERGQTLKDFADKHNLKYETDVIHWTKKARQAAIKELKL